jgi:hypothetical protein
VNAAYCVIARALDCGAFNFLQTLKTLKIKNIKKHMLKSIPNNQFFTNQPSSLCLKNSCLAFQHVKNNKNNKKIFRLCHVWVYKG